jgi:hypothetical protein
MSGAQQANPTQAGSVETAAASIEALLDRETGTPDAPRRPTAPRREPPARSEEPTAPREAETESSETLSESDDNEDDLFALPDDEPDSEEATADDEAEDSDEPEQRAFTVRIDGKEVRVTETELKNGYLRQQDYSRKTMTLSENDKQLRQYADAVRAAEAELRKERAQYAELLPVLNEQIQQLRGQIGEPDPALLNTDFQEYMRQRVIYDDLQKREQAAQTEGYRLWQLGEQERQRNHAALLAKERELIKEKVPAWASDERWKQAAGTARKYAEEMGYSDEEIRQVTDHRAVMILYAASRYAQIMKEGRATPNPPRVQQAAPPDPGPHPTRRRLSVHTQNKQRLAKSHSVADAAAVIRGLL